MRRSAFIYHFVFIQQIYECLHHISVLSKEDTMSYSPFSQGVYSLVETRDESTYHYHIYGMIYLYDEIRIEVIGTHEENNLNINNHHAKTKKPTTSNVKLLTDSSLGAKKNDEAIGPRP